MRTYLPWLMEGEELYTHPHIRGYVMYNDHFFLGQRVFFSDKNDIWIIH